MNKHKKQKNRKHIAKLKSSHFKKLFAAALAIPAIATSLPVYAQTAPVENSIIKFFYADYDDAETQGSRMHVKEPIAYLKTPLGNDFEAEGSYTLDSMSGASTYYLNTLTGASGLGVEDVRRAGDAKVTKYFENFSVGLGGVISSEDDYLSRGITLDSKLWTPDKNTIYAFGIAASHDHITSSIQESLYETRTTFNFLLGVTQVIDQNSIAQVNLTYATGNGYFSDPYKTLDNRPNSREQWALLNRYIHYIEKFDASLHTDYRLYTDTFGVNSHMFEVAWYQPLGTIFTLRPNVRYYSQNAANFFINEFPPENLDQFITGDQRMGNFGSVTLGMKLIASLPEGFSADVQYSYMEQRPEWKIGSDGGSIIEDFTAHFLAFGLSKTF